MSVKRALQEAANTKLADMTPRTPDGVRVLLREEHAPAAVSEELDRILAKRTDR